MSKHVLITGSGGFIFSNFIRKALFKKSDDYTFVSIDACKSANVLNNIYVNKGHKFYIGDISDRHFVNTIFELERPDIVINGAALTFVDDSIADADGFIKSNVLGTQVIIDACLKWKVERLIQVSTDESMGALKSDNDSPWKEDAPIAPRNPYSASKAAAEMLVQAAHNTHGLQYNITRSCNNYGPRQQVKNFIPKIISKILKREPVPVFGNGMQMREWIYVDDNCSGLMTVMEKGVPNEIYNISSGHEFHNIEVFQEICNAIGTGHDLITHVPDRPGHDFRYAIDSSKLRSLGWKPTYKFKQGIKNTIDWYTNNQWWFKS